MRKLSRLAWILAFSCPGIALAADASRYSLSEGVPDDVYIFIASRHNPKREFLKQYWAKVIDSFMNCGVMEEVWGLVTPTMGDGELKHVEQMADTAKQLIEKVKWGDLCSQQTVYMGRAGFPIWDNVFLTQNTEASTSSNFKGLREILGELAKMSGGAVRVEDVEIHGAKVARLVFEDAPFHLSVARRGEVLAIAMGDALLDDSLAMFAGKSKKSSIVKSSRFKSALGELPAADDSIMFLDAKRLAGDVKQMLATIKKQASQEKDTDTVNGGGGPDGKFFDVLTRVIDDIVIWDYIAETSRTEGFRVIEESRVALMADAKSRAGYKIFVPQAKFADLDRLVPREATGFNVSEGMQLAALYDYAIGLIKEVVPDGGAMLSQWKSVQNDMKLDVRRDVLGLMEGSVISASISGGGSGPDQWVMLAKVRDEKKAEALVQRLVDFVQAQLGDQKSLIIADLEVAGHDSFHSVSHPMFMMMQMQPIVWGTADGYLIFGSSAKPIGLCLKTMAGKGTGISGNARFQSEGIMPKGPFVRASFSDTSRTAEEMQSGLSAITMGLGMMTAFAPVPDEEGGKILKAIPSITGKLIKVADKMNFFQSEAELSTFDAKGWRCTAYANYKDPATLKEPSDDDDDNGEHRAKPSKPNSEEKAKTPKSRDKKSSDDDDDGD